MNTHPLRAQAEDAGLGHDHANFESLFHAKYAAADYRPSFESPADARRIAAFRAALHRRGDAPTVVFVEQQPNFVLLRIAMALRELGWSVYLLTYHWQRQNQRELFESCFDATLDLGNHPGRARSVIASLRPNLFHVQCRMPAMYLARIVMDAAVDTPVIVDFYDIPSIQSDVATLYEAFGKDFVDMMLGVQAYTYRHAHGLVTRIGDEVLRNLAEGQPRFPEFIQFWPYMSSMLRGDAWAREETFDPKRPRLVFAGAAGAVGNPTLERLNSSSKFIETVEVLTAQGIEVDLLHNPNTSIHAPSVRHYLAYAQRNPRFNFLEGAGPLELAERMQNYDFGMVLHLLDRPDACYSECLCRNGVGTKYFAYYEAGLPMIINAEHEYYAGHVVEHGLGLSVHTREIPHLAEILRHCDYRALRRGVAAFHRRHSMSQQIHRLLAFYRRCGAKTLRRAHQIAS